MTYDVSDQRSHASLCCFLLPFRSLSLTPEYINDDVVEDLGCQKDRRPLRCLSPALWHRKDNKDNDAGHCSLAFGLSPRGRRPLLFGFWLLVGFWLRDLVTVRKPQNLVTIELIWLLGFIWAGNSTHQWVLFGHLAAVSLISASLLVLLIQNSYWKSNGLVNLLEFNINVCKCLYTFLHFR